MNEAEDARDPLSVLRAISNEKRRKPLFRVYLGYSRGVGTTTAMLDEARRRRGRGTDVLAAAYLVHGPAGTALNDLGGITMRPHGAGNHVLLDVQAVLNRNPDVVCIDDLADKDIAGRPRSEAVAQFLARGIQVLATLHLLSLRSTHELLRDTVGEREPDLLLDDAMLDLIDELEFVDITPQDLLQRVREHSLLTPQDLAFALQREMRPETLETLREIALRLTADHSDRQLADYPAAAPLEFRGRIVVCIPPEPGFVERIRWAASYAAAQDAKLNVVSVVRGRPKTGVGATLAAYEAATRELGGRFQLLHGRRAALAIANYVQDSQATEVILGHRQGRRWPWNTTSELIRKLAGVDVHVVRMRATARSPREGFHHEGPTIPLGPDRGEALNSRGEDSSASPRAKP